MTKFSIILAVHNGEDTIRQAIESIFNLDYPKADYELIVINDGSTDRTQLMLESLKAHAESRQIRFKIIKLRENAGRIKARMLGVDKAQFNRLLITDTQLEFEKDVLSRAAKYPGDTNIISNVYMDKQRSLDDRILYLLRKFYYKPYWGENFPSIEITEQNFNKISKGTGGFLTNKSSFIRNSTKLSGRKDESDDTKLLYEYIKSGEKITRVPEIKILYKNRTGLASLKHLFLRGPKFVDYYISKKMIAIGFSILLALFAFLAALLITQPSIFFILILCIISIYSILIIMLSESLIDFLACFLYLPVIFLAFGLGILKGAFLKITRTNNEE